VALRGTRWTPGAATPEERETDRLARLYAGAVRATQDRAQAATVARALRANLTAENALRAALGRVERSRDALAASLARSDPFSNPYLDLDEGTNR
jgi:hypothetical protein